MVDTLLHVIARMWYQVFTFMLTTHLTFDVLLLLTTLTAGIGKAVYCQPVMLNSLAYIGLSKQVKTN